MTDVGTQGLQCHRAGATRTLIHNQVPPSVTCLTQGWPPDLQTAPVGKQGALRKCQPHQAAVGTTVHWLKVALPRLDRRPYPCTQGLGSKYKLGGSPWRFWDISGLGGPLRKTSSRSGGRTDHTAKPRRGRLF